MTAPTGTNQERETQPVAAGSDLSTEALVAERDGVVQKVTYSPLAAVTGAATNNRTVALVNKGQDGTGTTVVATLTFDAGNNAAASDEKAVPLSGTPANLNVASGDVLQWQSTHNGTGIADPGGLVTVTLAAKYA